MSVNIEIGQLLNRTHVKPDTEVNALISKASLEFRGQIDDLYLAVGALVVGRLFGWRVVRLTLTTTNYAKYQRILAKGLEEPGEFHFNEWMREREPLAYKSIGLKLADVVGDFWGAVKGRFHDLPLSVRRDVSS